MGSKSSAYCSLFLELKCRQGKDATDTYEPIHPPDTLDKYLDPSKHLGPVDMSTVKKEKEETDPQEEERQKRIAHMPILEQCYNLMDFEAVAKAVMKKTAWAYYSSGADDEIVRHCLLYYLETNRSTKAIHRPCEKITRHFTRYGLGHEFW